MRWKRKVKIMKKIIACTLLIAFLFTMTGCSGQQASEDGTDSSEYIYFGATAALSGDNALIGQYMT